MKKQSFKFTVAWREFWVNNANLIQVSFCIWDHSYNSYLFKQFIITFRLPPPYGFSTENKQKMAYPGISWPPPPTTAYVIYELETVQDVLIKLDIKPLMH